MKEKIEITGKIVSGKKQAAFFTQLDWVREQCMQKLGFKPFAGTLNVEIPNEAVEMIEALQQEEIPELMPPDANFCSAKIYPVTIENLQAAIVIPEEKIRVHGKNIIEIISSVNLKDVLSRKDGDIVNIVVISAPPGQMADWIRNRPGYLDTGKLPAGMTTVGVLSGFDDYDALKKFVPDAIIGSVAELREVVVF